MADEHWVCVTCSVIDVLRTNGCAQQEEKEQLIEYRSSVASLVGRAKTVVQLRPRGSEGTMGTTTPVRAICDYRQIEVSNSAHRHLFHPPTNTHTNSQTLLHIVSIHYITHFPYLSPLYIACP